jgi:hypothetical protein
MTRGANRPARLGALATLIWLAGPLGAMLPGCAATERARPPAPEGDAESSDPRRAEVLLPSQRLVVAEIADTPERVARGYMFRRKVREGEGMIFVFPRADLHPFWMKNTRVPLDMIWLDDDGSVVHIEASVPPCRADPCPGYGPPRISRYVLEVRAGTAAREGLKLGDRLRISFPQAAR